MITKALETVTHDQVLLASQDRHKDESLKAITISLLNVKEFDKALQVANTIYHNDTKLSTLQDLATELAVRNEPEKLREVSNVMISTLDKSDKYAMFNILEYKVSALALAGDFNQAFNLIQKSAEDNFSKVKLLSQMIKCLSDSEDIRQSIDAIKASLKEIVRNLNDNNDIEIFSTLESAVDAFAKIHFVLLVNRAFCHSLPL